MGDYEFSFSSSMSAVDRADWDGLAAPYDSPFLSWGFLALLEESGSIVPEKGWTPLHLLIRRGKALIAAAPLYAKTSSDGEFIWDFQFAEVAEANGIGWYPKLVGTIPATPAPAWRLLVAEGEDEAALYDLALEAAATAAKEAGFGGFHVQWPAPDVAARLRSRNASHRPVFAVWEHQSFLWTDRGFGDFEGWLSSFSKNMRRNVRREREGIDALGVERRMIEAHEAASTPGLLSRMADYYESTNDRFGFWAARWLERDFFLRLGEFMPEGWILGAAFDPAEQKDPIALSFMMRGGNSLWGRYWGTSRFVPGLHFELCYYLPVAWALDNKVVSFDPGMGSEHKARRGFSSVLAPSFHSVFDRRMANLVERSLVEANRDAAAEVAALNTELPYKAVPEASTE